MEQPKKQEEGEEVPIPEEQVLSKLINDYELPKEFRELGDAEVQTMQATAKTCSTWVKSARLRMVKARFDVIKELLEKYPTSFVSVLGLLCVTPVAFKSTHGVAATIRYLQNNIVYLKLPGDYSKLYAPAKAAINQIQKEWEQYQYFVDLKVTSAEYKFSALSVPMDQLTPKPWSEHVSWGDLWTNPRYLFLKTHHRSPFASLTTLGAYITSTPEKWKSPIRKLNESSPQFIGEVMDGGKEVETSMQRAAVHMARDCLIASHISVWFFALLLKHRVDQDSKHVAWEKLARQVVSPGWLGCYARVYYYIYRVARQSSAEFIQRLKEYRYSDFLGGTDVTLTAQDLKASFREPLLWLKAAYAINDPFTSKWVPDLLPQYGPFLSPPHKKEIDISGDVYIKSRNHLDSVTSGKEAAEFGTAEWIWPEAQLRAIQEVILKSSGRPGLHKIFEAAHSSATFKAFYEVLRAHKEDSVDNASKFVVSLVAQEPVATQAITDAVLRFSLSLSAFVHALRWPPWMSQMGHEIRQRVVQPSDSQTAYILARDNAWSPLATIVFFFGSGKELQLPPSAAAMPVFTRLVLSAPMRREIEAEGMLPGYSNSLQRDFRELMDPFSVWGSDIVATVQDKCSDTKVSERSLNRTIQGFLRQVVRLLALNGEIISSMSTTTNYRYQMALDALSYWTVVKARSG